MKWLIIFPDPWICYSPSIINFTKMLDINSQDYIVFYFDDGSFDNSKFNFNAIPIKLKKGFFVNFFRKIKVLGFIKIILFLYVILKEIKPSEYQKIVGVDSLGYIIASFFSKKIIYYSLEISKNSVNKIIFSKNRPDFLIIQSVSRLNYLAKGFGEVGFIQNSPILSSTQFYKRYYEGKLLYLGNIVKEHGVEICIESLYFMNEETLYIKGVGDVRYIESLKEKYRDLYLTKRFVIDNIYVEQEDLFDFIKDFDVGFCLYDFEEIGRSYNYQSSPSGKMFNYFMASMPVIGNNIIGLNLVHEHDAGILLDNVSSKGIVRAVHEIKENYLNFSLNAYDVAHIYDYEKMFMSNWNKLTR